ncbi:YdbL family protein [Methylocaldum sp.]|uniref:YdbL family protein n=1 Tax=Methylocaldum sp. TaxID=1969727 RepID=UPI002D335B0C|nr:YdbL family protein [Methylocaldum sp.]HYE37846.1 YdbL family protein [Methylocaldum sp.]
MSKYIPLRGLIAPLLALVLGVAGWAPASWAIGLDDAKRQGLVGEQPNGYLDAVVPDASADVRALIADINTKRRQKYEQVAKTNGTSLHVVETLAGKTAIEKTPPGQYVRSPSGRWIKK